MANVHEQFHFVLFIFLLMFGNLIYTISMQTFFSNPQYQGMIQVKNKFGQIRLLLKVRPRLQFPYFFFKYVPLTKRE